MKGFWVRITCHSCGQLHRIDLDDSGHYAGPCPCDPTQQWDLQFDPERFRRIVKEVEAEVQH